MNVIRTIATIATGALAMSATAAQAILSPGAFGPDSNPAVVATPPFGPLAPGGTLGTNYIDFGVDFSYGGVEGFFDDGDINEFGGINGDGVLDLLTGVDGRIVSLGTLTQSTSNFIFVEAGFAAPGTLLLQAFDLSNALIGSQVNTAAVGPNNRSVFFISTPGIAYFSVTGNDSFGVAQISIDPASIGGVPEPTSWAMLIAGFGLVGATLRHRRSAALTA
jgi:hypothetical protein